MATFPAAALAHYDKTDLPVDTQAREDKLTDVLLNAEAAFDRTYFQADVAEDKSATSKT